MFIVGPARSGTSIIYLSLRTVFGLNGPGESHVLPIFVRTIHSLWQYREGLATKDNKVLAMHLDTRQFRKHIVDFIRTFYASQFPSGAWVDKTPGTDAILGVPLIMQAFPAAKIIATKRSGLEVVRSFCMKFATEVEPTCHLWTGAMVALRQMTERFPEILLIDQYDILNRRAETSERIAAYLGKPGKSQELREFFAANEFDRSSKHPRESRLTLKDVEWSSNDKSAFKRICGPIMRECDYPM